MTPLRLYWRAHRRFALAIVMVAMLMRLLLPTGFMPDVAGGTLRIVLCTGHAPAAMAMAMHHGGGGQKHGDTAKHDMPCPFSSASGHGLAAADPIQLAIAIAFVMLLCLRPVAIPRASAAPRLRPPLRGPPLTA